MGFDFVNTRLTGITGPVTTISGSVSYQALNADLIVTSPGLLATSGSGSIIIRSGFIIGTTLSSSAQPF